MEPQAGASFPGQWAAKCPRIKGTLTKESEPPLRLEELTAAAPRAKAMSLNS